MDLEKLLREARPETEHDLSLLNARVLAAWAERGQAAVSRRRGWLIRCCHAVIEAPIPTLTVGAVVLSLFFWQAAVLLGADDLWIGRVGVFLMSGGLLP